MRAKSNWRVTYIFDVAAVAFLLGSAAYAANPVPTVTGPVHPQAVVPGHGDFIFILTVDGANFGVGAVVNWNGIPRSTAFVSARELQAKILASDVPKPTAGYITVTNPAPGGGPPVAATPLSKCTSRLRQLFQRHRTTIRSRATPSSF
jgi:hypothetical protein